MPLIIPQGYVAKLVPEMMEQAIFLIKEEFQTNLTEELNLRRVTAPLFVLSGTGVNDDLNGVERPVSFPIKSMNERRAEVVHSLAKWKRMKLASYNVPTGYGIYTDMNAIRADEELDKLSMKARQSMDQSFRKQMYKSCLDIIVDWAVEVPVYQRQNAIIFSTDRVNMDTVTPDITTSYNWYAEIQNIEVN